MTLFEIKVELDKRIARTHKAAEGHGGDSWVYERQALILDALQELREVIFGAKAVLK